MSRKSKRYSPAQAAIIASLEIALEIAKQQASDNKIASVNNDKSSPAQTVVHNA